MTRLLLGVFVLASATLVFADADGPDYVKVVGIEKDRVVNLRRGPSTRFSVVGQIPYDARGLDNIGCYPEFSTEEWGEFNETDRVEAINLRWCRITYNDISGWVYGKYLEED